MPRKPGRAPARAAEDAPAVGTAAELGGRSNQLRRTRQDLLEAAKRLTRRGLHPTLEEVATEALVSRATAYRHFPDIGALLAEASLDIATPKAEDVFGEPLARDAVSRLERVDDAFWQMIVDNEAALRVMLGQAVQRRERGTPARQNRRTPLIEAAVAPLREQFAPTKLPLLVRALALVIGTEGMIVCKDVLQLSDEEAQRVRRWAIRALVAAARKPSSAA